VLSQKIQKLWNLLYSSSEVLIETRQVPMLEITIQHADIRFLSGFSAKQIVGQLLSGRSGKFPAYDVLKVTRSTDLIVCDFFLNGAQVACVKAIPIRFV